MQANYGINSSVRGHNMAVTAVVSIFQVTPGKTQDFIVALRNQQEWVKSKGAGDMRVWNTLFSGENSGRVITVNEADSAADIGATTDAIMADWMNSPMVHAIGAGVATLVSRSIMVDMTYAIG